MSGATTTMDQRGESDAASNPPDDRAGAGWVFVDLVTGLDRAMHDVAHAFPAVDHRSRLPTRPTGAELDRIGGELQAAASVELRAAFATWRERDEEFVDAVRRLTSFDENEADPTFQADLERHLAEVRERRALVGEAADDLRRQVARELDAAFAAKATAVDQGQPADGTGAIDEGTAPPGEA
jgi:hypothetical protein